MHILKNNAKEVLQLELWWVVLYLLAFFGLTQLIHEIYEELQLRHGRTRGEGVSVLCLISNQEDRAEALIQRFIRLLAHQLPRSLWEIVMVDVDSTDSTAEICRRLSLRPGIKFISLAGTSGQDPVQSGRLLCDFPTIILLEATNDRSTATILANLQQALEPVLSMQNKGKKERG